MESKCLVSVVIPTYNAEKFISECLDATINQTYRNIEIIIVDDGSSDSTVEICRKYAERDHRIRIYTHPNSGVSSTRNRGVRHAKGDYIVFFDADDRPEVSLIERYMQANDQWLDRDVAFILCGMFCDNEFNKHVDNTVSILESAYGYIRDENYLLSRSAAATLAWLKLFNFVTNKFYDLRKIKDNGIVFDPEVNIGEDLKFNLDYLEKSDGFLGMINSPLYHYIKRSNDSLSISYHKGDIEDTKAIYRRFIEWEAAQADHTEDNLNVLKGIYITDWVSRMSAVYEVQHRSEYRAKVKKKLRSELRSKEFKSILYEVFKAKKISRVRFYSLNLGSFEVFFFLRGIYQVIKG